MKINIIIPKNNINRNSVIVFEKYQITKFHTRDETNRYIFKLSAGVESFTIFLTESSQEKYSLINSVFLVSKFNSSSDNRYYNDGVMNIKHAYFKLKKLYLLIAYCYNVL